MNSTLFVVLSNRVPVSIAQQMILMFFFFPSKAIYQLWHQLSWYIFAFLKRPDFNKTQQMQAKLCFASSFARYRNNCDSLRRKSTNMGYFFSLLCADILAISDRARCIVLPFLRCSYFRRHTLCVYTISRCYWLSSLAIARHSIFGLISWWKKTAKRQQQIVNEGYQSHAKKNSIFLPKWSVKLRELNS